MASRSPQLHRQEQNDPDTSASTLRLSECTLGPRPAPAVSLGPETSHGSASTPATVVACAAYPQAFSRPHPLQLQLQAPMWLALRLT